MSAASMQSCICQMCRYSKHAALTCPPPNCYRPRVHGRYSTTADLTVRRKVANSACRTLAPEHHEWMLWVRAAIGLANGADDAGLLLEACSKKQATVVDEWATDEDVYTLFMHALVAGLDAPDGARALRRAFELDSSVFGASIDGFIHRWVPADFDEEFAYDVRRILS